MWILILLSYLICGKCDDFIKTSMRWVDHKGVDLDIDFDHAVFISYKDKILTSGVFLGDSRVLTSFNPFRKLIQDRNARKDVIVSALYHRLMTITDNGTEVKYEIRNYTIACARQVIPVSARENVWHGADRTQSPLHDLMIIRLDGNVIFYSHNSQDSYESHVSGKKLFVAGPKWTVFARDSDILGRDFKFASLGFLSKSHIKKFSELRSHSFEADDNAQVDCDEWLPRSWGIFICIRNDENFKGLGSGALLFYENKLFGVGSFMLRKGDKSILVFTDVRPYNYLIFKTCTKEDQALVLHFTTSTTTTTTTKPPKK